VTDDVWHAMRTLLVLFLLQNSLCFVINVRLFDGRIARVDTVTWSLFGTERGKVASACHGIVSLFELAYRPIGYVIASQKHEFRRVVRLSQCTIDECSMNLYIDIDIGPNLFPNFGRVGGRNSLA